MKTFLIQKIEEKQLNKNYSEIVAGKVLFITFVSIFKKTLRKQSFWGICLGVSKKGINTNFILRNTFYKEGVTRSFFLNAPNILNIKEVFYNNNLINNYKSKLYFLKKKMVHY